MILTDEQSLAIYHAAKPLQPQEREKFLVELHRELRSLQQKYFRPPDLSTPPI